jgi:hypothetical protein
VRTEFPDIATVLPASFFDSIPQLGQWKRILSLTCSSV